MGVEPVVSQAPHSIQLKLQLRLLAWITRGSFCLLIPLLSLTLRYLPLDRITLILVLLILPPHKLQQVLELSPVEQKVIRLAKHLVFEEYVQSEEWRHLRLQSYLALDSVELVYLLDIIVFLLDEVSLENVFEFFLV